MTPDEVVSVIEKALKQVAHYNRMSPSMHRTYQEDLEDAYKSAISLIQDYQKLRERVSVEKIEKALPRLQYANSNEVAQAIVTYLQQPSEPRER